MCVCLCDCMGYVHIWEMSAETRRGCQTPWRWSYGQLWVAWHGCWKPNSDAVHEQQGLHHHSSQPLVSSSSELKLDWGLHQGQGEGEGIVGVGVCFSTHLPWGRAHKYHSPHVKVREGPTRVISLRVEAKDRAHELRSSLSAAGTMEPSCRPFYYPLLHPNLFHKQQPCVFLLFDSFSILTKEGAGNTLHRTALLSKSSQWTWEDSLVGLNTCLTNVRT